MKGNPEGMQKIKDIYRKRVITEIKRSDTASGKLDGKKERGRVEGIQHKGMKQDTENQEETLVMFVEKKKI